MRRSHSGTHKWSNIPGSVEIELAQDIDLGLIDPRDEISLVGTKIAERLEDHEGRLLIEFESSGSFTPMSMYGGADNLGWPAEAEDERIVTQAVLIKEFDNREEQTVITDKIELQQLADLFAKRIEDADLTDLIGERDDY